MKKTLVFLSGTFLALSVSAQSFSPQTSGTTSLLTSIDFINDNLGLVVSETGQILKTTDGGAQWISQSPGIPVSFRDVIMINTNTAVAVGLNGVVLRTTNGGTNWNSVSSGITDNITSVIYDGSMLYAVASNGKMIKSSDEGATWTVVPVPTTGNLRSVYFTSSVTGYIAGENGRIFKTTNGGVSWTQQVSGLETSGSNYQLHGMHFTDANNGIIIGGISNNAGQGVILRTTNAGASWTYELLANNYLVSIDFVDATTGFIAGGSISGNTSKILKTNDGGNSWQLQSSASSRQWGVAFPSYNAAYTCGLNGTILKIEDINLDVADLGSSQDFYVFPNPTTGRFELSFDEQVDLTGASVVVLDAAGKIVLEQKPQAVFDISDLTNGVYFVKVSSNQFNLTRKIIKE